MKDNVVSILIVIAIFVFVWHETKSYFGFLERSEPQYKEGDEQDKES